MVLQNELVDEELEHFDDMAEEPDIQASNTADKPDRDSGDDSENENEMKMMIVQRMRQPSFRMMSFQTKVMMTCLDLVV